MKIVGVVVLYNPDESVVNNINSYIDDVEKLYLIDNSSIDNSNMFKHKKFEYIANYNNLGIAKALNMGAEKAIKEGYEWLLTMDQDSMFEKNAVKDMLEFLNQMKSNTYLTKVINTTYEQLGLISPLHMVGEKEDISYDGIETMEVVMTSGNIINLKAYQKISGFKDWLFIDCVDFDYCLNLISNGYNVIRLNFVKLNHNLGNQISKKILWKTLYSSNHSAVRRYYMVRNKYYIYDMYHDKFPIYCSNLLKSTNHEHLKIWLCEKNKFLKNKYIKMGKKHYQKGIKGELNEK